MITGMCVGGLFLQQSDRDMVLDRLLTGIGVKKAPIPEAIR
jgi:hypothetical protein